MTNSEPLTAAVKTIERLLPLPGQDVATFNATQARVLAVLDRLLDAARSTPEPGLDVERLNQAMVNIGMLRTARYYAERITAEYAALADQLEPEKIHVEYSNEPK